MTSTVVLPPEPVEPFPTRRQASARPRGKRASDKPAGGARKNLRLSCFCCVPELAQPVPVMVAVRGKALVSELLGELTAAAAPQRPRRDRVGHRSLRNLLHQCGPQSKCFSKRCAELRPRAWLLPRSGGRSG